MKTNPLGFFINYDTGELTITLNGENLLTLKLCELNQNSEHFQEELLFQLTGCVELAYNQGRVDATEKIKANFDKIILEMT